VTAGTIYSTNLLSRLLLLLLPIMVLLLLLWLLLHSCLLPLAAVRHSRLLLWLLLLLLLLPSFHQEGIHRPRQPLLSLLLLLLLGLMPASCYPAHIWPPARLRTLTAAPSSSTSTAGSSRTFIRCATTPCTRP
jgi:hypothetical protein